MTDANPAADRMHLKVLLPSRIFATIAGVSSVVAETSDGSFGLLPHRLDCVAALVPGIVTCVSDGGGEVFMAVDQGVLVKTGLDLFVSVRRAQSGVDLAGLRAAVEHEFLTFDEDERRVRALMAGLEAGFLRRFASAAT